MRAGLPRITALPRAQPSLPCPRRSCQTAGRTIHEYRGNCGATRPCGSEGFIPWVAEMHTGWRTVTTYPDGSTFTSAWTETTA